MCSLPVTLKMQLYFKDNVITNSTVNVQGIEGDKNARYHSVMPPQ